METRRLQITSVYPGWVCGKTHPEGSIRILVGYSQALLTGFTWLLLSRHQQAILFHSNGNRRDKFAMNEVGMAE